ncbi:MAG: protein kinase domain-containing protein, partial [Pyrinomonadaceae bacterium]
VHEIGVMGTSRFIATEFIDGKTLRQRINSEMTFSEILEVAIQAGGALVAAHEAGIIHRDIKPENIMIRRDGYVKLLDFGLAKLTQPEGMPIDPEASTKALVNTSEGAVMGTANYMSPEQAKGTNVDARTDLWSLGAVLYEMIAGRAPFAGQSQTETLTLIIQKDPAPLTRFAREVPDELQRIVNKLLAKDRDQRYQSAKDLLIDLRNLKHRLDVEAEIDRTGPNVLSTALGAEKSTTQPISSSAEYVVSEIKHHKLAVLCGLLIVAAAAISLAIYFRVVNATNTIDSIAVLPFVNASGNAELEYLSDGMTESLINSLSQLPNLSVKARSSVFRYKGKEVDPQQVASQLSVQAVLNGRVTQRGDDLMLHLSLVDGRSGNQIWGEQYNRKLSDLLVLQSEIARDVSSKLRARLSGADQQKLAKNYTANTEAYQLYLRGRYHVQKLKPPEVNTGISYFQQALEIDPSYALAYVGLADAYRAFALSSGEMSPTEFLPKAKAAAQKAIEIDDDLADAHSSLGTTLFWYDWDWPGSEKQIKRALELDPNLSGAHVSYAHYLLVTERYVEAVVEMKRARELEPLNLRTNALEG